MKYPDGRVGDRYFKGSGTSQATAVVSGAVALLLSARPRLKPDQVKALLTGTADCLLLPEVAGAGAGRSRYRARLVDALGLLPPCRTSLARRASARSIVARLGHRGRHEWRPAGGRCRHLRSAVQRRDERQLLVGWHLERQLLVGQLVVGQLVVERDTGPATRGRATPGRPASWSGNSWSGNSWSSSVYADGRGGCGGRALARHPVDRAAARQGRSSMTIATTALMRRGQVSEPYIRGACSRSGC